MRTHKTLGYATYEDYLASEHWKEVQRRFQGRTCLVCGSLRVQLHHVTYERLGEELDEDIRPLCLTCHHRVHDMIGEEISLTDDMIVILRWELERAFSTPSL